MEVTEPQSRKNVHLHTLLGGLGFRNLYVSMRGSAEEACSASVGARTDSAS